ncbi:methylisocitrate lyase [Thermus thermophilus]|uniref:methylisocitrate lyase n=1 Tax=Thermus thermophilus TaxID=274 RepID=UPI001FCC28C0|nr:methylisocitrate lyase [Thermus thermophilus]BDG22800.1 2-methylisocitrate lyase [Thermus thermophilus]BDG29871.1 2-methylisocitrate lyase [Thermus thermophilus]
MAWFAEEVLSQEALAERLRALLQGEKPLVLPGAPDGLAALIAKRLGFQALYLSGAAYTASRALPDLGLVTLNEVLERAKDLVRASGLPLLVDADTGFGGVLNAFRAAREFYEARVAAIQVEDQVLPKRCGHLEGKALVEPEEMAAKVQAIKRAAPSLFVVARTDAYAVEGLERAIARAKLYAEAGADAIFPEALPTEEAFLAFRRALDLPLLANMTEFGKTPYLKVEDFARLGYQMVIFPVTALRLAAKAYERAYRVLLEEGTQVGLLSEMQTRAELYNLLNYEAYEALDRDLARSLGLPQEEGQGEEG